MNHPTIVYCFNSLKDPLVDGLILTYLKQLGRSGDASIYLITQEQTPYAVDRETKKKLQHELAGFGIIWKPFPYHNGKFLIIKKIFDFSRTSWYIFRLRLTKRPKRIIGFLPIAGAYAAILGKFLRMKSYVYCYEPHSQYLVDFGTWQKSALKYKLLQYFERFQIRRATEIVVPTKHTETLIKKWNPKGKITVLPISVDTELFRPMKTDAKTLNIKLELGFSKNDTVLIYTGKLSGLYYSALELAAFLKALSDLNDSYRFLIITNNSVEEVHSEFTKALIDSNRFKILPPVPYKELPWYINVADLGLLAIPPNPSQKYRTPVKTGLYLACGIPYLTCEGIAEDDTLAVRENIGVVIPKMTPEHAKTAHQEINNLFRNTQIINKNCRRIAVTQRDSSLSRNMLNRMISK
jgi:glycosyltransferase involved in cell wall biosynthesis